VSTTLSLESLYFPVQDALSEVRKTVSGMWGDALQLVGMDPAAVPDVGGKMLRPALCLLSAGAIGAPRLNDYVQLASAFEALHIASLAHDDVIDKALMRRGKVSLNGLWNNHAAVLGGDYLVARAVETLAEYDSCAVIANAIRSVREMSEGELYFFFRDQNSFTRDECIMLARLKTASLFAEACAAPSFVIEESYRKGLHDFGIALGIAFQIVDDILDVTQTASSLGKPSCGDVVEGKRTLPILYMREKLSAAELEQLNGYRDQDLSEADQTWIAAKIEETGARERSEAEARAYAAEALAALAPLPPSPYRESMEGLVEFVLVRVN